MTHINLNKTKISDIMLRLEAGDTFERDGKTLKGIGISGGYAFVPLSAKSAHVEQQDFDGVESVVNLTKEDILALHELVLKGYLD